MEMKFNSRSGRSVDALFVDLRRRIEPTRQDMLTAANIVKSDIRDTTERGIDADGRPFQPYSSYGPYYYNPSKKHGLTGDAARKRAKTVHRALQARGLPGSLTGSTIKFKDYGEFKRSFARLNVDLLGIDSPNMLNAMQVEAPNQHSGRVFFVGEEPNRLAAIHNLGLGNQPERRFFAISQRATRKIMDYFAAKLKGKR